ncbi:MAG: ABC transporter ATP-binding protein [Oscillospiraceae bacterium]
MFKLIQQNLKGKALLFACLAPLCMLVEVFMDLQQPTLMSDIIDIGVKNADLAYVLKTGAKMLIYTFWGMLGGAACGVLGTYASVHFGGELRKRLFGKIFTLDCAKLDELETSSLVTRMTGDVTQMENTLMTMVRSLFRSPVLCVGSVIMAFRLSPRLALILCIVIPILAAIAVFVVRAAIPLYTKMQQGLDKVNTVIRENLLGIKVVKSMTLEQEQSRQFDETNHDFLESSVAAQMSTYRLMPIVTLVMNFCIVAILWFGGHMQVAGELPEGRIMALINYVVQLSNTMTLLVNLSITFSRAQASVRRIDQVLNAENTVAAPEQPAAPDGFGLEFRDVSFSYSGGENILKHISFSVRPGERLGIIGATGCGKSTLAALTARMYDPAEGQILLGGVDLRDISEKVLRKEVGIVLQNSRLFSGTVAENLRYGKGDAGEEELWEAARDAAAEEFLRELPEQLDAQVAQRGGNFSGGQKQRLSIARSLLHAPHILILDDSTSALDLLTEAQLQENLQKRLTGSTIIYIAQRISSIMNCDHILVMDRGCIAAQGTHAQLLESCEIYRSIAQTQLGEEAVNVHGEP